ncbi:MAG: type II toxin-antitoxin system RelE/ParE family toxin [Roseiarcus sp.]
MRRYALSQEAEQDLGDIRAYYLARASARTTRYVMREITKAMGFLASTPGAGHSREDLTDAPVKFWPVFSYLIIYDPATQPIGVARVLHGGQDLKTLLKRHTPRP